MLGSNRHAWQAVRRAEYKQDQGALPRCLCEQVGHWALGLCLRRGLQVVPFAEHCLGVEASAPSRAVMGASLSALVALRVLSRVASPPLRCAGL